MTYGSKLVHAKCKTVCDGDGQPNGLLHWLVVHGVVAYCHLDWQVENNQPLRESLKALSARALSKGPKTLGVAQSGNKYSAESSSLSVKLRALDNCFLSAVFDIQ
jgi:hypothetical protein